MNRCLFCLIFPFFFISYTFAQLPEMKLPSISFSLFDQKLITYGQSLILEGLVANGLVDQVVDITLIRPSGYRHTFQVKTTEAGRFSLDEPYQMDAVGSWRICVEVNDNGDLQLQQREESVWVKKGQAEFLNLSQTCAKLDQVTILRGHLLSGKAKPRQIHLAITAPDGERLQKQITTQLNGAYAYNLTPNQIGRWQVELTWLGDANYQPLQKKFNLLVTNQVGQAVVVLGHLLRKQNEKPFNELGQKVFQTFVENGFKANQDIRFLSAIQTEISNTGATIEALKSTLTEWINISPNVPLYLYLLSGNWDGQFLLADNNNELVELSPSQLASWLSPLKLTTIVVDASYSGRFIMPLLAIPNRTIITSSRANQQNSPLPSLAFSSLFCQNLRQNQTLAQAFRRVVETISHIPSPYGQQLPQLATDGDIQPNEWTDFSQLGQQRISLNQQQTREPSLIFEKVPDSVEIWSGITKTGISIQVSGQSADRVFATIISPNHELERTIDNYESLNLFVANQDLVKVETDESQTNTYQLVSGAFEKSGIYTIVFHAQYKDQLAWPISTTVSVLNKMIESNMLDLPKSKLSLAHSQTAYLAQNLVVSVQIEAETLLAGWSFDFSYDPKKLSFQEAKIGSFLGAESDKTYFESGILKAEIGLIRRLLATRLAAGGSNGAGQLLELSFKTVGIGASELELKNATLGNPNGQIVPLQISNSVIKILGVLPGDANIDGKVDILDLVTVGRHFSQKGDQLPGDLNDDGQVNILDLVIVAKHYGDGEAPATAPAFITLDFDQKLLLNQLANQLANWPNKDVNIQTVIDLLKGSTHLNQVNCTQILPNYPNPFNPETWIPFTVGSENNGQIGTITIYDSSGRLIRVIDLGQLANGVYFSPNRSVYWDGKTDSGESATSGIYFCVLTIGVYQKITLSWPMVIIK